MFSVLLIDDHDIVLFGLRALIQQIPGIRVIGVASTLQDGLVEIEQLSPDLVISDLSLPDSKGLDTARMVINAQQRRSVLVLSMHDEAIYATEVLRLGGRGYLMKDRAQELVCEAVSIIAAGGIWVSPEVNQQFLHKLHASDLSNDPTANLQKLTPRESEVFTLLGQGLTTKEIARSLDISIRTVDLHRRAIKSKLVFKSSAEMIAFASEARTASGNRWNG